MLTAGLCVALCAPAAAAVQGAADLNQTFMPSSVLYERSDTFFLPTVPEIQFSTITAELSPTDDVSFVNGNVKPMLGVLGGQYQALAHISFTTWWSIDTWDLPVTVGPGGWQPSDTEETNLASWDLGLLAFSVDRPDGRHYGWMEFSVTPLEFVLRRYGFEDVAGRAIQFGDYGQGLPSPIPEAPPWMLLLAGLSIGVTSRRLRRRTSSAH